MGNKKVIVSVSGGKDSTATLLIAIEKIPRSDILAVFADTGNEHEAVYEYIEYLKDATGIDIQTVRRDFNKDWWRKRDYIRDCWAQKKGVSDPDVARALKAFEKGPSGNPFYDLCMTKGRFPSRMAQFCTQFLKKFPLNEFATKVMMENKGSQVESWQGVRAEESERRAKLSEREDVPEGWSIYRPILKWSVEQVFAQHRKHGIKPNPLYKLGMGRVGCMPCINVNKKELYEISRRFSTEIDRIRRWELDVGLGSRRGMSSFFAVRKPETPKHIDHFIEWSKTEHGGTQYDLLLSGNDDPPSCSSSYGLCE